MVELLFEKHSPPAVFLGKNAMLTSFAVGRQTSLVVDAGHEATVGEISICNPKFGNLPDLLSLLALLLLLQRDGLCQPSCVLK